MIGDLFNEAWKVVPDEFRAKGLELLCRRRTAPPQGTDFDPKMWDDHLKPKHKEWAKMYAEIGLFNHLPNVKKVANGPLTPVQSKQMCSIVHYILTHAKNDDGKTLPEYLVFIDKKYEQGQVCFTYQMLGCGLEKAAVEKWAAFCCKASQDYLVEQTAVVEEVDGESANEEPTQPPAAAGGLFGSGVKLPAWVPLIQQQAQQAAQQQAQQQAQQAAQQQAAQQAQQQAQQAAQQQAAQQAQQQAQQQAAQKAVAARGRSASASQFSSDSASQGPSDSDSDLESKVGKKAAKKAGGKRKYEGKEDKDTAKRLKKTTEELARTRQERDEQIAINLQLQQHLKITTKEVAKKRHEEPAAMPAETGRSFAAAMPAETGRSFAAALTPRNQATETEMQGAPKQGANPLGGTYTTSSPRDLTRNFDDVSHEGPNPNPKAEQIVNEFVLEWYMRLLIIVNVVLLVTFLVHYCYWHYKIFVEDTADAPNFPQEFKPFIKAITGYITNCEKKTSDKPMVWLFVFGIPIHLVVCLFFLLPLSRKDENVRAIITMVKNKNGCLYTMCVIAVTVIAMTAFLMGVVYWCTDFERFLIDQVKLNSGAEQCKTAVHENEHLLTLIPLAERTVDNPTRCTDQFNLVANDAIRNKDWTFPLGKKERPITYMPTICNFLNKQPTSLESAKTWNSRYRWSITILILVGIGSVCYFFFRKKPHKFKVGLHVQIVRKFRNGTTYAGATSYFVKEQLRNENGDPVYKIEEPAGSRRFTLRGNYNEHELQRA